MIDDGWEPISQDDGWEPVSQPPLAQLSQPDAVLPWQKVTADPEVPLAVATRYTPLGLLPLAAAGLAGGMQKLMKLTEPVGLAAAGEGGGDVGALSDAIDSEGIAQDIGNDLAKVFHKKTSPTPTDTINTIRDALSFEPTTARAKAVAAPMDWAMEKVGKFAETAGSKVLDVTGSPALAAATDTAMQLAPLVLGEKVVRGTADNVKAARSAARLGIDTLGDEVAGDLPRFAPPSDLPLEKAGSLSVPPVVIPLSPDARHAALQDQHGLTPEQKAAFPLPKDPLTGWDTKPQLDPTIEAAKQSGEPSTYVELDLKNLGGLNKHAGSISAADEHLKAITDIAKKELDSVGEVVPFKKGGDEFAFVVKGADPATTHDALAAAQEKVNAYAEENGLHQIENPKGGEPGTGIHFAATEIHPDRPISDTVKSAESLVEARKQGAPYERPDQEAGSRPLAEEPASSGPAEAPQRAGAEAPRAETESAGQVDADAATVDAGRPPLGEAASNGRVSERTASARPEGVAGEGATVRDSRVANAATYVDRATRGVEQLPEAGHKPWAESKAQAAEKLAADPEYARNLAQEVVAAKAAGKTRVVDDVETMALGAERQKLQDAYHQTHTDILKARESADPIREAQALAKRTDIENQLDLNERAAKSAGTDLGQALAARNAQHAEDYTPARNITRAKVAFGDKFNEAIRKQVEDLSNRLAEAEAKIARQEANKPAPEIKVTRADKRQLSADERMQAQIEKKMAKLQEAIERRTKACPI